MDLVGSVIGLQIWVNSSINPLILSWPEWDGTGLTFVFQERFANVEIEFLVEMGRIVSDLGKRSKVGHPL